MSNDIMYRVVRSAVYIIVSGITFCVFKASWFAMQASIVKGGTLRVTFRDRLLSVQERCESILMN
jgi:hypothetical protein